MLRLAEQCDTEEWYISLAEQNWRTWPPLRGYFFGRTGLSFGRKKLLAPPKKCPKNAYDCTSSSNIDHMSAIQVVLNIMFHTFDFWYEM